MCGEEEKDWTRREVACLASIAAGEQWPCTVSCARRAGYSADIITVTDLLFLIFLKKQ